MALRETWELRLDATGVTVRGHATIPWWQFTSVDVIEYKPRWMMLWFLMKWQVVAFMPVAGPSIPVLPSHAGVTGRSQHRSWDRWYGTRLLVLPSTMDASTADIVAAVLRFSDVPVREDQR